MLNHLPRLLVVVGLPAIAITSLLMVSLASAEREVGIAKLGNGPVPQHSRVPSGKQAQVRRIDRLIFLSHPYAWELQALRNREWRETYRLGKFTADDLMRMEQRVSSRWPDEIRKLGPKDFLIINYFGNRPPEGQLGGRPMSPLLGAAKEHLGDRFLILFGTAPSNHQGSEIRDQLQARGYTYDPARVRAESWGQSTEGCVPNYSAHFAAGMGLRKGFPMRYELTFPDAAFAMTGRYLERLAVGETDVCAYLSESDQGRPFAIFFPGVLRDGESSRAVEITIDPSRVEFTDKQGVSIRIAPKDGRFRVPLNVDNYGAPIYVWGVNLDTSAFRSALKTAVVREVSPE